jgi:hypothetical protein
LLNADLIENTAPIAHAGTAQSVVECKTAGGALVRLDASTSSDPDGDQLDFAWAAQGITFDDATRPTQSALFPLGTTLVELTVTDGLASNTDQVAVTVLDTLPPELTVSVEPSVLWPPNGRMVDVRVTVRVVDRCDPTASFALVSVASNQSSGQSDDEDVDAAVVGTPDTELRLRATRDGAGIARRYSIIYEGRDRSGNGATATTEIEVPHDLSK